MNWNRHSNLEGTHATFGASQSSWLRYSDDKVITVFLNKKAAEIGTRLHAWAKETIDLGIKQSRSNKTLCAYVNDAIAFKMNTEVLLYYSKYFYGTADAISFKNNTLRIHDLKTGSSGKIEEHIEQLEIYAAFFCLEYDVDPSDIKIELRVYKSDEVLVHNPTVEDIVPIMDRIIHIDKLLAEAESEGL